MAEERTTTIEFVAVVGRRGDDDFKVVDVVDPNGAGAQTLRQPKDYLELHRAAGGFDEMKLLRIGIRRRVLKGLFGISRLVVNEQECSPWEMDSLVERDEHGYQKGSHTFESLEVELGKRF